MTSRILASKISLPRPAGQDYLSAEDRLFSSSSPYKHLKTDKQPVLRQTLAVLGGFVLAGLLVLAFLSYLIVVVG